jgi:hypothetical protein
MPFFRRWYDQLPASFRTSIRRLFPDDFLRWYAHQKTDVYLISYPKCGRTWLRLMMGRIIASHFHLPEEEDILLLRWKRRVHPQVEHITVIHDNRPMLKTPQELETSKARYANKKVIFLVRDPRDVIVSSYFELKHRSKLFAKNPYENQAGVVNDDLQAFIFQERSGIDTIINYYNIWANNRHVPSGFLMVRYEDLRANPNKELQRIMDFLGLEAISSQTIEDAINFASFDNMRKMEMDEKYQSEMLKPADRKDENTFKTRKGKIKGYVDYLSPESIALLDKKIHTELSDFFGYD